MRSRRSPCRLAIAASIAAAIGTVAPRAHRAVAAPSASSALSHGPADPAVDGPLLVRTDYALATLPDGSWVPFSVLLPAGPSVPRPVVLVVHGYGTVGWDYAWIAEHLASRGFACGLVETRDPFETDLATWSDEAVAALDALARANADPWSGLYGELDLSHVAAVGHSYGAATAIVAAARDARIKVVAALEPGAAAPRHVELLDRARTLAVPLLVVGGELDPICPPATQTVPTFAAATGAASRLYVEIARGDHLGLLEFYAAPPPYRPSPEEHAIASRYFTAWVETRLLGRADPDGYTDGRAAARDVASGELARWLR